MDDVHAMSLSRRLGPERGVPATMAVASVCGCLLLALVDPNEGGRYPVCPTRALLGIDCPACGTLRGLHSLSRGRIDEALDHNLLLVIAVPVGAIIWWQWVRAALGRPPRSISMPRWAPPVMIGIAMVFAIVRNLPIRGITWLNSA